MESAAGKPTALAKLIGFYTIEIRNLETGVVQSKADVLVTENVFYDRNISKTFDLKVHGCKVKLNMAQGHTFKTLFEGQQHALIFVHPHSKNVLREAIKSEADFLARRNIFFSVADNSICRQSPAWCRRYEKGDCLLSNCYDWLIVTIGSYAFAKTLAYKAKHGLQSGKEVTVVPPIEHQERFVPALEGYFLACPDKCSKPLDDSMIVISDPDLPSVL
ncbi:hypothetical protein K443DRAFT_315400 [Laccaria amethystina LaAM-08-1]|uniref:PIPK domain-containing protein n=1 Tax=Laccaria amethystina LaAM-08-1 TaxID=1095629 RepID=A0A0C9X3I1_9AGAR|nr:hypothetical protein K443DRAFT_315400 [Laccaria amethystina LaAM-08-1]